MKRQTTFQNATFQNAWISLNTSWHSLNTLLPENPLTEKEQGEFLFDARYAFYECTLSIQKICTSARPNIDNDLIEQKNALLEGEDGKHGLEALLGLWQERLPEENWSDLEIELEAACNDLRNLWSDSQGR